MIRLRVALASLLLLLAVAPLWPGMAAEAPLELKWAELVPPRDAVPPKPKTFFSEMPAKDGTAPAADAAPPPPLAEGKFMATKRKQPGSDKPPAVVAGLNGKRVAIGGYVVPLDFEAATIKEFLLVPFVGACIHVPPPPANQIIYVKSASGIEISGSFDPVKVTGTLKTETAFTGLADAGYSLEAETVEIVKP